VSRIAAAGPDYYERRAEVSRQVRHHVGKLGALGFDVTLCRIPEPGPEPGGTGNSHPGRPVIVGVRCRAPS
jgi:hypothetical protein